VCKYIAEYLVKTRQILHKMWEKRIEKRGLRKGDGSFFRKKEPSPFLNLLFSEVKNKMTKVIFATGNKGKLKEIKKILGPEYDLMTMAEVGFDGDIVEDGQTFEENAAIKARAVWDYVHAAGRQRCIVMADDSGLCVDALDGGPGVFSARFMGEDTSYDIKNQYIIDKAEGSPARFVCAICAILPDGKMLTTRGLYEGIIASEIKGTNGFGYDPILYVPEKGCSSAELSEEAKNEISHRGKALRAMSELLKDVDIDD